MGASSLLHSILYIQFKLLFKHEYELLKLTIIFTYLDSGTKEVQRHFLYTSVANTHREAVVLFQIKVEMLMPLLTEQDSPLCF